MLIEIARTVRDVRRALGWSQRELASRSGVAQSTICRLENAVLVDLTIGTAERVLGTLGVRAILDMRVPFIADRKRQRDAGHARCIAYVVRRLRRLGWVTLTEVEIVTGQSRGWIDVLAYRPGDRTLAVIEVKTELADLGQAQRQLAWYERAAWQVARQQGWHPRRSLGVLLALATARSIERLADNREHLLQAFPTSALELTRIVTDEGGSVTASRSVALIDPYNRSKRWLLTTPISGRVARPPYEDYAGLMARIRRG